jgi:hypothetical protein
MITKLIQGLKSRYRLSLSIVKTYFAKKGIFFNQNDRKLWSLRNKHQGEDAVVIGMGPSLRKEDLDRFENFVSFACNKIYLAYEETQWRPDYYSVIDVLVAENNIEEIEKLSGSVKLFPATLRKLFSDKTDAMYFEGRFSTRKLRDSPQYADHPLLGVAGGYTVLIPLIQAAYWMGCKNIYVVGLDFSFDVPKEVSGESKHGEQVVVNAGEKNHFHKDYRKPGETWTYPRMEDQQRAFEYAKIALEKDGRRLINASRSTKLEILEKADFDEIFPVNSLRD